jgi:hypothetical protein
MFMLRLYRQTLSTSKLQTALLLPFTKQHYSQLIIRDESTVGEFTSSYRASKKSFDIAFNKFLITLTLSSITRIASGYPG